MTITNEAQLANSLETLLRVGFDYLGIIDPYDRIMVALSALKVYSDKMHIHKVTPKSTLKSKCQWMNEETLTTTRYGQKCAQSWRKHKNTLTNW